MRLEHVLQMTCNPRETRPAAQACCPSSGMSHSTLHIQLNLDLCGLASCHVLTAEPGPILPCPATSARASGPWWGRLARPPDAVDELPVHPARQASLPAHSPALTLSRAFSSWEQKVALCLINMKLRRHCPTTFAPSNSHLTSNKGKNSPWLTRP